MSKRTFSARSFAARSFRARSWVAPRVFWWRGSVDTDWDNQANWSLSVIGGANAGVPGPNTICIFGVLSVRACTLTANALAYSLALGATWAQFLTLGSFDMAVSQDVDILAGGLDRGDGAFTVGGDFTQLGGRLDFNDAGPATMAIAGDLDVQVGGLWFVPQLIGHTITVGGDLSLNTLTLTASGEWFLNVTGTAVAVGVNVAYSNASGGTQINALDETNTDSDNNTNWLFEQLVDQIIVFPEFIRRTSLAPGNPLRKTSGVATPMRRTSDTNTTLRRPR